MLEALDGPAKQYTLSITDGAVVEVVKPTEDAFPERKVVTMQATTGSGKFRIFWGDGSSTPSVGDVQTDGILQFKFVLRSYEATAQQPLYIISESGNITVHIVERA
jgi:hypothetical protein